MELDKCINERRSIRDFSSKKVSKNLIKKILNNAILAPSGHNRQPWYFVIIEDKSIKNKISSYTKLKHGQKAERTAHVIETAPVLILVYNSCDSNNEQERLFDIASIGACMQNICLSAYNEDLGSLWIGYVCAGQKEINNLINSKNKELVGAIALGHPNESLLSRPRKKIEEISEWI